MASNAKIGLLLGLVVVFAFMFIINGLPGLDNEKDVDEVSPIAAIETTGIKPNIPPEAFPTARRLPERQPEDTAQENKKIHQTPTPDETDNYTEPVKQSWPKIHVVNEGDNLAEIAKKFYGRKEGNRRANIKRIFEANNNLLESPDKIFPGQKLIIPPLWASRPDNNGVMDIFPDSMFEEVNSIGRRHL